MARRLFVSFEAEEGLCSFGLAVPGPDVPSTDLVTCVRERLAIPLGQPLYFTLEPDLGAAPSADILPLSAALPDGTRLRLHTETPRKSGVAAVEPLGAAGLGLAAPAPGFGLEVNGAVSSTTLRSVGAASRQALLTVSWDGGASRGSGWSQRCCRCLLEGSDVPPPKEITTDLANERTLLAWIRTGLAVIRTVFSFATLSGLTKGLLTVDVFVTMLLAFSAIASLVVGWQRWAVVRSLGVLRARRFSIWPVFSVFVAVAGVCFASTILRQPKRLQFFEVSGPGWAGALGPEPAAQ